MKWIKDSIRSFIRKPSAKIVADIVVRTVLVTTIVLSWERLLDTPIAEAQVKYSVLIFATFMVLALFIFVVLAAHNAQTEDLTEMSTKLSAARLSEKKIRRRYNVAIRCLTQMTQLWSKRARAVDKLRIEKTPDDISLRDITDFDTCIYDTLDAIKTAVEAITSIKINVVYMTLCDDGALRIINPDHFVLYDGKAPYMWTAKEELRAGRGCAGHTLAAKKIKVFPDVSDSGFYKKLDQGVDKPDFESLVCIPICRHTAIDDRTTCGILNISASDKRYFSNSPESIDELKTKLDPFTSYLVKLYSMEALSAEMTRE